MTGRSKFVLLCVTIAMMVVASTVRAQTDTEKEAAELEKKTLALLNEIASASWGLKLAENRVYIMASTADLLWPFDDKRARNLYWEALNSIVPTGPPNRKAGETSQPYSLTLRMRRRVLLQAAHRDTQLALAMLQASRQVSLGPESSPAEERWLEQEIAGQIAARDPTQALQLARESLAKGVTFQLANLLQQLQHLDIEKASVFAGEIITRLQTTNVATNLNASLIALY